MHEDMRLLLNAYLDGELQGTRLMEIKLHLAACESCRDELRDLCQVSDLLQAAPSPDFLPADRFTANLTLELPRRNLQDLPQKSSSLAWWLVPAGLLGAWFFIQTVFTLSGMATAAQTTGLFGNMVSGTGGEQVTTWSATMSGLFGGQLSGMLSPLALLNDLSAFGTNVFFGFLWQALIVLLYWAWLLAWWLRRRPQPMEISGVTE